VPPSLLRTIPRRTFGAVPNGFHNGCTDGWGRRVVRRCTGDCSRIDLLQDTTLPTARLSLRSLMSGRFLCQSSGRISERLGWHRTEGVESVSRMPGSPTAERIASWRGWMKMSGSSHNAADISSRLHEFGAAGVRWRVAWIHDPTAALVSRHLDWLWRCG
jgi:hypothetical protein